MAFCAVEHSRLYNVFFLYVVLLCYRKPDGQWINTVTFCAGKADVCVTDLITTIANVSLPVPGVIKVEYTDAPLDPQVKCRLKAKTIEHVVYDFEFPQYKDNSAFLL